MATKLNKTLVGTLTVVAMVVLGVVGVLMIYTLPGADPARFEEEAKKAEEKGDWKAAYQNHLRAYQFDRRGTPTQRAERLTKAAQCMFELGEFGGVKETLKQAQVLDSQYKGAQELLVKTEYELAKTFPSSPQWKAVLDEAKKLVALDPQQALGQEALGRAYLALSGEDSSYESKGESAIREALKLNPTNTDAAIALAEIFYSKDRNADADALIESTLKQAQASKATEAESNLHVYRGKRLLVAGKLDEAQKEFREAESLTPNLVDSHIAIAAYWSLKGKDHLADAEAALIKAKEVAPKTPEVYLGLGRLYAQQGKPAQQIAILEEGLKAVPKGTGFRSLKDNYMRILLMKDALRSCLGAAETSSQPAESLAQAESWLKRAENEVGPDRPDVRLMRASLRRAQGRIVEATQVAEQLDKSMGRARDPEVKALLADLYALQGQNGAAADALQEALRLAPRSVNLYVALGRIYLRQGNYEAALRAVQPENFPLVSKELAADRDAAMVRSECYRRLDRAPEVEKERKFLAKSLNTPMDRLRNAQMLAVQEKWSEAEQQVRDVIKENPNSAVAFGLLAQIFLSKKPPDEKSAREAIDAGLKVKPDDRSLKILSITADSSQSKEVREKKMLEFIKEEPNPLVRAVSLFQFWVSRDPLTDDALKQARAALDEAYKADPNSPYVIEQQFKFAIRNKDWATAEKFCAEDAKLNSDGTRGRLMRGRLAMAKGDIPKAIEFYRDGLNEYPSNSLAWTLLAGAYLMNNQRADAQGALEGHALKLDPANGEANRMMAAILLEQGDKKGAKPYLEAAAKAIPGDTFVREQLQILEEENDPKSGIASREKVRESEPDNLANLLSLASLYAKVKEADKADECLRRVIELNQNVKGADQKEDPRIVNDVARIYGMDLERPAEGEKILQELLKRTAKKEDKAAVASMIAQYYQKLDNLENAERYYLLSANLSPTAAVTASVGEFYARTNRPAEALDWFQKARDLAKDDKSLMPTIRTRIIQSAIMMRDKKRAEPEIEAYIRDYPDDENGPLFKGLFYLQVGDVTKAEQAFREQLERKADSAVALWQSGQIYMMRQRWSRAIEALQKAKAFRPSGFNYEHRIALARALFGAGRYDEGVAELQSILQEAPNTTQAAVALMDQYLRAKKLAEAETLAVTYMRRFPDDFRWPQYLGQIGIQQKDERKAIEGFGKAVETSRFATTPVLQLLSVLETSGRFDDVVDFVQTKLPEARRRRLPMAEAILGKAYAAKKEPEEAAKHFDAALVMARDDFEAYRYIAMTMARALGADKAIEMAQKRLEADKAAGRNTSESLKLLMQLEFQADKYDEAIRIGEQIIDAADRDDDMLFGLMAQAIVMTKINRFDEARQKYESALRLDPGNPVALNNLAFLLVDSVKKPQEALAYAERAESIAPRDPNTIDTLGWVLAENGRLADAEGTLLKALDIDSTNLPAMYHLAVVYQRMGNKDDAKSRFEAVIREGEKSNDKQYRELAEKALKDLSSGK